MILPQEVLEYLATHAKFELRQRSFSAISAREMTHEELVCLAEGCAAQGYTKQDGLSYEVWAAIIDYEQKTRYLQKVEEIRNMLTDILLCAEEDVNDLIDPLTDLVE